MICPVGQAAEGVADGPAGLSLKTLSGREPGDWPRARSIPVNRAGEMNPKAARRAAKTTPPAAGAIIGFAARDVPPQAAEMVAATETLTGVVWMTPAAPSRPAGTVTESGRLAAAEKSARARIPRRGLPW
jgi:hypothetical protein